MNMPDIDPLTGIASTRPYLIRALHEWCCDNGFTPYLAVAVDASVQVPREFVKNHEIVLNIGMDATSSLKLGNDWIEFKARFAGSAREIMVPVSHVSAIYARENGQGMAFSLSVPVATNESQLQKEEGSQNAGTAVTSAIEPESSDQPPKNPARGRPSLKRIK